MKVHITLVGEQPMPVYSGIVASKPEKVVFVFSKNTKKHFEILKNELDDGEKHIPYEKLELSPFMLDDIEGKVRDCAERYKNDEVTINISGGTKPWSIYFAKVFGNMPNAKLFYVDQNNVYWNLEDHTNKFIPFDVDALFRIKGNPLNHYKSYMEYYDDEDKKVADQMERFRELCYEKNKAKSAYNALKDVTAVLNPDFDAMLKDNEEGCFETKDATAVWEKGCRVTLSVKKGNEWLTESFASPHVTELVFNSGWFELKVAKILASWKEAKEIRMNCLFPVTTTQVGDVKDNLKNEIDIIVITDAKPVFVECKAGNFNSTEIQKFKTAVENYGGRGAKSILVTGGFLKNEHFEKLNSSNMPYFIMRKGKEMGLLDVLDRNLFDSNA